MSASDQLLVVIDPYARRCDGESVRIAKDVLSAGAAVKLCLPDSPGEFARALARRGARRPVVVGDDRALLRAVSLLHRERELDACALSLVPVGAALSLAHSLGVPVGVVAAARAVLDGAARRLDLLVDDSDGVVLGQLLIPSVPGARTGGGPDADGGRGTGGRRTGDSGAYGPEGGGPAWDGPDGDGPDRGGMNGDGMNGGGTDGGGTHRNGAHMNHIDRDDPDRYSRVATGPDDRGTGAHRHSWLDHCQALVRALAARPLGASTAPVLPWGRGTAAPGAPARLRVEADGVLLADLDEPVRGISVVPCDSGLARVEVLPTTTDTKAVPLRARARTVTVSGPDFRYRADSLTAGPVRTRTWTTRADAWALTLPIPAPSPSTA